jgi:hypothetical protein
MAPTSLLAGIILVLADQRIKAISRSIPRGEFASHFPDILTMGVIRFGAFFLSWLLGAFALAATATVISELDTGNEDENWNRDSYQRARECLRPIIGIAAITFCLFLLGLVGVGFVESAALRIFGGARFLRYNYPFWLISYVVIAAVVSWLGASVPLVLRRDAKISIALKKSVELSSGYEAALLLLVVESVVGSLIAWYTVVHGLPLLLPSIWTYRPWYVWVLNLTGILASAVVEPPLFIGFALLADPDRFRAGDVT